jgi:hypothetical protein
VPVTELINKGILSQVMMSNIPAKKFSTVLTDRLKLIQMYIQTVKMKTDISECGDLSSGI